MVKGIYNPQRHLLVKAMSRVPGQYPQPTSALQLLIFVKHTPSQGWGLTGQRVKVEYATSRVHTPLVFVLHTKKNNTETKKEQLSAMRCVALGCWGVPSGLQRSSFIFRSSILRGVGRKAPYLIRTWKAIRHHVVTSSQGRKGSEWEMAYQLPILSC